MFIAPPQAATRQLPHAAVAWHLSSRSLNRYIDHIINIDLYTSSTYSRPPNTTNDWTQRTRSLVGGEGHSVPEKNANKDAKLLENPVSLNDDKGKTIVSSGLENVIAAETVLSRVDGERGELLIRGLRLEDVAGVLSFEGTCQLLWTGDPVPDIAALKRELGLARVEAFELLGTLDSALEHPDAMEALRAALAQLSGGAPGADPSREGIRITAAVAVFAAAWARRHIAAGPKAPVTPDPTLGHAEDYLRMVAGPEEHDGPLWSQRTCAIDAYLSTVAEHGMNASTFAARVVASTGSDAVSAVVAALCALKGPLHGGAPGPVLDMLDAIGRPETARKWLEAELESGRRIMGLGHRIYRVRDPRAAVLEATIVALRESGLETPRLVLARAVEREAMTLLRERYPDRPLETNVEFYTAILLDGIGLDRRLFSATFAVARVAGWLAHIAEQRQHGRLIRPRSRYVGPLPEAA
jgi:citrate synthase